MNTSFIQIRTAVLIKSLVGRGAVLIRGRFLFECGSYLLSYQPLTVLNRGRFLFGGGSYLNKTGISCLKSLLEELV